MTSTARRFCGLPHCVNVKQQPSSWAMFHDSQKFLGQMSTVNDESGEDRMRRGVRISAVQCFQEKHTDTRTPKNKLSFISHQRPHFSRELTRFCAKTILLSGHHRENEKMSICNCLDGRRFDGSKRGWSDWVCAARSQQPCQENCATSAQTHFLKKCWSDKSVIVIPWLLGMCDDDVNFFSLTSCVSAADVFIVCVNACVAMVSVNFAEFFSGSDTGNAGQMDPLLSM